MRRYAITLDTDWAPDAAIDFTADLLAAHNVKATWFVTHMSPAIERLRGRDSLFELGIHPNFLAGSSHGATPEAVLDHCMELVPEARSMRTHALVQSTPILDVLLRRTPIRSDVTIFLPRARQLELVDYQWKGERLLRVPYFWEDDVEMLRLEPCWDGEPLLTHCEELSVFAFHPIHVMRTRRTWRRTRRSNAACPSSARPAKPSSARTRIRDLARGLCSRSCSSVYTAA